MVSSAPGVWRGTRHSAGDTSNTLIAVLPTNVVRLIEKGIAYDVMLI
jgi:hypothetical protein